MQIGTYDLVLNFIVVVMMPLIIWANLRNSGFQSPLNQYLWREFPNLMRTSLIIIAMITLYSALELLRHFGILSEDLAEIVLPIVGVPFLVAAIAMIWFSVRALLKVLRSRSA